MFTTTWGRQPTRSKSPRGRAALWGASVAVLTAATLACRFERLSATKWNASSDEPR